MLSAKEGSGNCNPQKEISKNAEEINKTGNTTPTPISAGRHLEERRPYSTVAQSIAKTMMSTLGAPTLSRPIQRSLSTGSSSVQQEIGNPSAASEKQQDVNKEDLENKEFKIVQYKKRKPRYLFGTNTNDELSAYVPQSNIMVSKLDKKVTKNDVMQYISKRIPNIEIQCEQLKVRTENYNCFKVSLPVNKKEESLAENFWPSYVGVKLFRNKNFWKNSPTTQST